MHEIEVVIAALAVILLALLGRGLFVLVSPYRACRWCKDRKRQPRPWNRGRCWFCRNTRLTRRLGAKQVHKIKLSLIQAWGEREFRR